MRLPRLGIWVWPLAITAILGINAVIWLPKFTTSDARFCLSCHGQRDTADISKASKVHPSYSKVGCTECHARSERHVFMVDLYREGIQASSERVSSNCFRCHKDILTKDPSEYKSNELDIGIPHNLHYKELGIFCTTCHRNVEHDFNEQPTNRPRMEFCMECHDQNTEGCITCHPNGWPPGIPYFSSSSSGPPKIPHSLDGREGQCLVCHKAGVGGAPKVPDFHLSGDFSSRQCLTCHKTVGHVAPVTGESPSGAGVQAPGPTPKRGAGLPAATPSPAAGGPPAVTHSLEGRQGICLVCHKDGLGGAPKAPEFHISSGFGDDACLACHKAS